MLFSYAWLPQKVSARSVHPTELLVLETFNFPASTLKYLEAFQPTKHIHVINYDDSFNPM